MTNRIIEHLAEIARAKREGYPEVTKEIGDRLRQQCADYVNACYENHAEEILGELENHLEDLGLLNQDFIDDLVKKRRARVLEIRGREGLYEDFRSLCRDYVTADNDIQLGGIIEELGYTLEEVHLKSEKLFRNLEMKRQGIIRYIKRYQNAENDAEKVCYKRALEHRLKEAKFEPKHITALFEDLDIETAQVSGRKR